MNVAGLYLRERRSLPGRAARVVPLKPVEQQRTLPSPGELCRLMQSVAATHDRTAFAALFGYFAPRVKAFLMRSGLSANMAEEVTQETMLAMWHKASYFDPSRAGVSTWIYAIARNQRIDRLRREQTHTIDRHLDPSDELEPPDSGEDIALVAERDEQVRTALAALSSEQATIVHLSFFADKPHAEIARELGIPLGTVKSRIRLALNRLRSLLGDET
ncbi:MAG: sigma-70 family RNA polymerase sigma factor [Alphaproteobacteria bacterium]|nr:sigma-70 family RNA polymerase sigma factor [Alphaproteobacteria bacterium]